MAQDLEKAVFEFTRDAIAAMDRAKVSPEMVQIGNEITNGFLWDDGKLSGGSDNSQSEAQWGRFAGLLKAAIRGIKEGREGKPAIPIMIHVDRGGDNAACRWFFNHLRDRDVEFDLIGLSYYPWWQGTLDDLRKNLDELPARYEKDVIIVETGYPCSPAGVDSKWPGADKLPASPEAQRAFLAALVKVARGAAGGHCKGIYYWEPAWLSTRTHRSMWYERGFFDRDGNLLDSIRGLTDE